MSWLSVVTGKVSWSSTIEAGALGRLSLGWSRRSNIPLKLRGPIRLRPLNILWLVWPDYHLLLPLLLIGRPRRCLVCYPRALRSTTRRTSSDLGLSLLKMVKPKIFFHSNGIINQLVEVHEASAQTRPKLQCHS